MLAVFCQRNELTQPWAYILDRPYTEPHLSKRNVRKVPGGGQARRPQGPDSIDKFWLVFWLDTQLEFWVEVSFSDKKFRNG